MSEFCLSRLEENCMCPDIKCKFKKYREENVREFIKVFGEDLHLDLMQIAVNLDLDMDTRIYIEGKIRKRLEQLAGEKLIIPQVTDNQNSVSSRLANGSQKTEGVYSEPIPLETAEYKGSSKDDSQPAGHEKAIHGITAFKRGKPLVDTSKDVCEKYCGVKSPVLRLICDGEHWICPKCEKFKPKEDVPRLDLMEKHTRRKS